MLQRALAERAAGKPCKVVGLMSGTSLDGLDIVLVTLRGSGPMLQIESIDKFETIPLDKEVRRMIQLLLQCYGSPNGSSSDPSEGQPQLPHPLEVVCKLNAAWSRFVGEAVNAFLLRGGYELDADSNVVVGSHGQTLWHEGHHHAPFSTLQLGDGEILSAACGRVVVCNFRNSDVGAGGCGAPLVPYTDRILAAAVLRWFLRTCSGGCNRDGAPPPPMNGAVVAIALQNLGGIGNVSSVHMRCPLSAASAQHGCTVSNGADDSPPLMAFDTGPANAILNEIVEVAFDYYRNDPTFQARCWSLMPSSIKASPCDWNGCFSSLGSVHEGWLREWLGVHEAFLKAPPPKSTGREAFGAAFVQRHCVDKINMPRGWARGMPRADGDAAASEATVVAFVDLCRTAVALTARTIAFNYRTHLPVMPSVVALSGGGAWNPTMVAAITEALHGDSGGSAQQAGVPVVVSLSHAVGATVGEACAATDTPPMAPSSPGALPSLMPAATLDDAKEAIAFAILAHEKLNQLAGVFAPASTVECGTNVTTATGATRGVVLGQISAPS